MDASRTLTLTVVFRKDEDGGIVAECLEIPGCLSQGDTQEEAEKNIADAIEACLSVILEDVFKEARLNRVIDLVGIERQETIAIAAPRIQEPVFA